MQYICNCIKFTIEHEENGKLPFLDTCVKRSIWKYGTTIYHKKTFTGVYLNWTSLTARKYKIGLIHCLLNRIQAICSEQEDIDREFEKLKKILLKNQYPEEIILEEIERFKKKRQTNERPDEEASIPEFKRYIVLPYANYKCEDFARRLKQLVVSNFPQVDFNVAYQTPKTISNLFPFKDNIKKNEDKSLVVYKLNCKNCDASYIGKCKRILSYRIYEHKNDKESSCYQHATKTGHVIDYDNIEVIDKADSDMKLRIKELLHILKRKPSLNKQLNSQSNHEIKTLIIQAYPQFRNITE